LPEKPSIRTRLSSKNQKKIIGNYGTICGKQFVSFHHTAILLAGYMLLEKEPVFGNNL
jgi:hypothetical protein